MKSTEGEPEGFNEAMARILDYVQGGDIIFLDDPEDADIVRAVLEVNDKEDVEIVPSAMEFG